MLRCATRGAGDRVLTIALLGALLALAAACSSHVREREAVNEREYAPYREPGNGVVVGQVSLTLKSGEVLEGAAGEVRLTPVTSESTLYIQNVVMAGDTKPWKEAPDAIWWVAQADTEGRFRFEEVPAGSYYLTCLVAWRPSGSSDAKQRILWGEATVGPNETVTVSVSR
jgi:hypothetical protein